MRTNWKAIFMIAIVSLGPTPFTVTHAAEVEDAGTVEVADVAETITEEVEVKVTNNSKEDPPPPEVPRTAKAEDTANATEEQQKPTLQAKVKTYLKKKYDNYRIKRDYGGWNTAPDNLEGILAFEQDLKDADDAFALAKEEEQRLQVEAMKLRQQSLKCLTLNGWHEARDQTFDHETAVNSVVLNRLAVMFNGATSICEVILQPGQFEWVRTHGTDDPIFDNEMEKRAWNRSVLVAERLMNPYAPYIDTSHGSVYYYNDELVKKRTGSDWKYADAYEHVMKVGDHRFMKEKKGQPYYIDTDVPRVNPIIFNGLTKEERKLLNQGE